MSDYSDDGPEANQFKPVKATQKFISPMKSVEKTGGEFGLGG